MNHMLLPKGIKPNRNKPKRYKDEKHLNHVRSMRCCACGCRPVEAHHLLRDVVRGTGLKAGDNWVIPLCSSHHRELHANGDERAFLKSFGINGPVLAQQLFKDQQNG
jgi:hypothetical protein